MGGSACGHKPNVTRFLRDLLLCFWRRWDNLIVMKLHQEGNWLLTALFVSLCAGCKREVQVSKHVSKEMTWECAPDRYMPKYPDAHTVRFRFVEDPHYEDVISGRGLCDQLKSSGRRSLWSSS